MTISISRLDQITEASLIIAHFVQSTAALTWFPYECTWINSDIATLHLPTPSQGPSMKALHWILRCARVTISCHLLHFRLHVSPPGVSWPSSFPLPLWIPCHCLSCDARCRFSQCVTNPTPLSSFYLYFYWQLMSLGPQSVVADFV